MNTLWPARPARSVLATLLVALTLCTGVLPAVAADAPSPTVGTSTPSPPPPGDTDEDPNDWTGTPWVVAAIAVFVVAVGGVSYLGYRRLKSRDQAPL
ncbi:hypothetical protein [Kribbella lupini]|uniref:LPXTG-motif cell wall-anchored protein n=1 Tax=Kribbella lupini TaxID=291602 RepID=A0ABP4LAA5_9ACTN